MVRASGGGRGESILRILPTDRWEHVIAVANTANLTMNPFLFANTGYDPRRDLAPLCVAARLMNGPDTTVGAMTTGGTESILLAVLAGLCVAVQTNLTAVAQRVLGDWEALRGSWVKVFPRDFKRVLREAQERATLAQDGAMAAAVATFRESTPSAIGMRTALHVA